MDESRAPESSRSTNGKAIAALVLGFIGMTGVLFVASIVAIALGTRARREIEETGQGGTALATTGIALGWIALGAVGLLFILFLMEVV